MTLLYILAAVFAVVALMVILGERYGKPMAPEQQSKYSKIIAIACFVLIVSAIVKQFV